jgi:hypothetical protein
MKISDAAVAHALEQYVQNRWSPTEFAQALGVTTDHAGNILRGVYRKRVTRPLGFEYPWPERSEGTRAVSAEQIARAYERYQAEDMSIREFARSLGVSKRAGWLIFHGYSYKEIERPEIKSRYPALGRHKKRV